MKKAPKFNREAATAGPTSIPCRLAAVASALAGSLLLVAPAYAAQTYWVQAAGYQVDVVRPGGDRPCTLFMLVGVSNSDPVMPSTRYFAIPNTAPEYKAMVATLLAAKMAGRGVNVVTTGQVDSSCGQPGVSVIELP